MEVFDEIHAKKLRQTGNFEKLFDYCSSYPDDAVALCYLALCYHNGYGTSKNREIAFFMTPNRLSWVMQMGRQV